MFPDRVLCFVFSLWLMGFAPSVYDHFKREVVNFLLSDWMMDAQQVQNTQNWPRVQLPKIEIGHLQTTYDHSNANDSMFFYDVGISVAPNPSLRQAQAFEFEIQNGWVEKVLVATLCQQDDRCSASSFILKYHLKTHYITVSNDHEGPGLLKYDFNQAREVSFTHQDIKKLNCILRTELNDPTSYLWAFEGVEKYDQPSLEVDAVTGATSLMDIDNYECGIPDGALWTTLTVFAHAYEFGHQVRQISVEDLINQLTMEQNTTMLDQWKDAMTKHGSITSADENLKE
jgi:hypothetical protein